MESEGGLSRVNRQYSMLVKYFGIWVHSDKEYAFKLDFVCINVGRNVKKKAEFLKQRVIEWVFFLRDITVFLKVEWSVSVLQSS